MSKSVICLRHEAGKGGPQPIQKKGGDPLAPMFTRKDGFRELSIIIQRALDTGLDSYVNLRTSGPERSEDIAHILGGVTSEVKEILDDYAKAQPQRLYSEEEIRKESREVDHHHH